MRDFFVKCFKDLHSLTGLKQYVELCANSSTETEAQTKLDEIIMGMIRVSNSFNYIPLDKQQEIIRQRIIDDPDFYALNARVVYKWLNAKAAIYFHEEAHKPGNEPNATPVTWDDLSPETQKLFSAFLVDLGNDMKPGMKKVPTVTQKEIDDLKMEDLEQREGKESLAKAYAADRALLAEQHERKMNAIRSRGLDKLDFRDLIAVEIEGVVIHARTKDEAQEIYIEVYA